MSTARILVVDDQPLVLDVVGNILRRGGYDVVCAADPRQALKIVEEKPGVDLVLSDIDMPHMRGTELLGEISRVSPGVGTVLMTGGDLSEREIPPEIPLLHKPILTRDLLATVQRALERGSHARLTLQRQCERARELQHQSRQIQSELAGSLRQAVQSVRAQSAKRSMAPIAPVSPNAERLIWEQVRSTQQEWFDVVKEFSELYASLNGKPPLGVAESLQGDILARLSAHQRSTFERHENALHELMVMAAGGRGTRSALARAAGHRLTERETEVLAKLAEGKSTKQTAHELNMAFKTAATHRTHLLQKFNANNVALLIRKAVLEGFIRS